MSRGLYVMGTEPGAGCTTVACAVAAALRTRGQAVGVLKPVAVGCAVDTALEGPVQVAGIPGEQDAEALAALARLAEVAGPPPAGPVEAAALSSDEARRLLRAVDEDREPGQVTPYRFALPLEPAVAARAVGSTVDLQRIHETWTAALEPDRFGVVDGGVGPLVPLGERHTVLDLVQRLAIPVLLVAPSRPWGAINPTLAAHRVLTGAGVEVVGVVLNRLQRELRPEEAANPYQIERHGGPVVRGMLPHLPEALADPQRLGHRFAVHVDLDGILKTS